MNFWKHKKIIFGILAAVVFMAILAPEAVVAEQNLSTDTSKDIGVLAFIGGSVLGWVLSYVAGLIDFAIKLSYEIFKLEAVTVGWKIMLNFTNLGFVLGIIIIAFATILRIESYGMKQILWKLVVAALLVNFSLVIAGAFISVSNTVADVFLDATTADNLSNALANAMQPQKFLKVKADSDPSAWSFITGGLSAVIKFLTSLLFILIFTFLTILAFLTLFVMLLVRIIFLILLLIVSPVVWLLWIFPHTQKYWTQWWEQFIRWNIFAPAVLFFVYLTVVTAKNLNQLVPVVSVKDGAAQGAANAGIFLSNESMQHGMNLLILLGLLYGGIYVANKFSIAGGSIGVNMANSVGKGVGAWAGRKGIRTAGWVAHPSNRMLDWATNPKAGRTKQFIGRSLYRMQSGLSSVPGAKQLGQAYRAPGKHRNIAQSIWGGLSDGSGLFKKYKTEAEKGSVKNKKEKLMEEYMKIEKEEQGEKKEEKKT